MTREIDRDSEHFSDQEFEAWCRAIGWSGDLAQLGFMHAAFSGGIRRGRVMVLEWVCGAIDENGRDAYYVRELALGHLIDIRGGERHGDNG